MDMFIQGMEVSLGCIPTGDAAIEELFYFVATAGPKKTRVVIMPVDFRRDEAAPEIAGIGWEADLYSMIRVELRRLFGD